MKKYYDNLYDIEKSKKDLQKLVIDSNLETNKKPNCLKEFVNLIKKNVIDKKVRYSTFAIISFNIFPNIAGQAFTDTYTYDVFTDLGRPELGADINFYSGFIVVIGSILAFSLMNSIGRKTIFIVGNLTLAVSMWLMSLSFYLKNMNLVFVSFGMANFSIYFGFLGIYYVYVNELGEPFVVG